MFNFWTSGGQALYQSRPNNGQALVSIYKDNKQIKDFKEEEFKKSKFNHSKKNSKHNPTVPYADNLKTTKNKNYGEPL